MKEKTYGNNNLKTLQLGVHDAVVPPLPRRLCAALLSPLLATMLVLFVGNHVGNRETS